MTVGWGARTIRAAVFAAVCVVLAALGHVMMSGDHVPAGTLVAGWAVIGVVGWCLAGRERGLAPVVSVAVAAQTALHSAFSLAPSSSGPAGAADSMDMGSMSMGHDMGAMPTGSMDMGGHLGHAAHTAGGDSSFGMLAAHLLAALLCGLWLGHGERAAFRLLGAVAGRLAAPLRLLLALPAPPDRAHVRVRHRDADRAPRLLLLVHAITLRGPPAGAAAV